MRALAIAIFAALILSRSAHVVAQQPVPAAPVVQVPGTTPTPSPEVPTQTAVSVKEVSSPAAPTNYQDQAIWALMVSLLIQYLKNRPWFGWLTPQSSARLQAQFGFVAALITSLGIHFAVSGSIFGDGGATVTVTGLSFNAFKDFAWQWASQQAWYRALVKEPKEVTIVKEVK
jgi:hypothetical protein